MWCSVIKGFCFSVLSAYKYQCFSKAKQILSEIMGSRCSAWWWLAWSLLSLLLLCLCQSVTLFARYAYHTAFNSYRMCLDYVWNSNFTQIDTCSWTSVCVWVVGGRGLVVFLTYCIHSPCSFPLQQESKEESGLQKKRTKQLDRTKFAAKRQIARRSRLWGWGSCLVLSSFCCLC